MTSVELKPLIAKLSSPIAEIQARSLTNLYMKITHNLVSEQCLLEFPELPGLLLGWINDNKKKSDLLLKVLSILQQYCKFDQGKILLRQYQCLQFCEEFKTYLLTNERGIEMFKAILDEIIRAMLPLGRANQSAKINSQNTSSNIANIKTDEINQPKHMNHKSKNKTVSQIIKFKIQLMPLDQASDKIIFELLMKLKYANKDTAYITLTEIRQFVSHYSKNHYRCKSDLVNHLCDIALAGIFPQLCMQIISIVLRGVIQSQRQVQQLVFNSTVNLTYAKITKIQTVQIELPLPLKLFEIVASFAIIQLLVEYYKLGRSSIQLQYMLMTEYKYSPFFYLKILNKLSRQQINLHENTIIQSCERYARWHPDQANNFIHVLPQSTWRKISSLLNIADLEEENSSFASISTYLNQKQFSVTKNLHIMREIVDNLKIGLKGLSVRLKQSVKVYVDVLAALAISLSRQDPIMSYYTEAQDLVLNISKHQDKHVAISLYEELLSSLSNTKNIIHYPGLTVAKHEVIQVIFTSHQFTKKLMQHSLEREQCLKIMLKIVIYFVDKDKSKVFHTFYAIIFALCEHNSQQISIIAKQIVQKVPKNSTTFFIALKLFSENQNNRKKILSDLCLSKQTDIDIVEKISEGHYTNKKKALRVSKQSIDSYLNIILNPGLEIVIKQSAIVDFIDCIQRAEQDCLQDLEQAQEYLINQIKHFSKKEKLELIEQKIIILHLLLWQKTKGIVSILTVQFLIGLLCKVSSHVCKAHLLTAVYLIVFQSPFSHVFGVKNFAMLYFPHIEMVKMEVQHPVLQIPIKDKKFQTQPNKPEVRDEVIKMDEIYKMLLPVCLNINKQIISQDSIQSLQSTLISALTTSDLPKISKLSFLISRCGQLSLSKSIHKIMVQYIRTNSFAIDLADDLVRIMKCTNQTINQELGIGNNQCSSFILLGLRGKIIGNQQTDKILKYAEDPIKKSRIFAFLIKQRAVKFSSFNQYTSLKLLQSIISSVRNSCNFEPTRMISLSLLHKVLSSQLALQDHIATIQTLLHSFLFEHKPDIREFYVALSCYSLAMTRYQQLGKGNLPRSAIQQVCSLVVNSTETESNNVMVAACFCFLSELLRSQLMSQQANNEYFPILQDHPKNMLVISANLIPKNIAESLTHGHFTLLLREVFNFLYLYTCFKDDAISILLQSTDILSIMLQIIPAVSSLSILITQKVEILEALGRLLQMLASRSDEFIFRLNKVLRNDNTMANAEYKLHYTLMCALLIFSEYSTKRPHKLSTHCTSYLSALILILTIYDQKSSILDELDFIEPLIRHIIDLKQLKLLAPLLRKSTTASRIVGSSSLTADNIKQWIRYTQDYIYEKQGKNKKYQKHKVNDLKLKIKEGLAMATCLYSATSDNSQEEITTAYRDNLLACIRFIDHVGILIEIDQDEQIFQQWCKLLKSMFRNSLCSKPLGVLISQGNFETISKLLQKVTKPSQSTQSLSQQLSLLGEFTSNESIRSLIIKSRLIDQMVNTLIAMDQNKVAKINYGSVYGIVSFLNYLSAFKDTNAKIQNDKKLIDILAKLVGMQQSQVVEQKILDLLINLAAFKHSKSIFMSSREIHKVCLGLLSEPEYEQKHKILCLIYNILYKHAAAVKIYRKKEVMELVGQLAQVQQLNQMAEVLLQTLNSPE